MPGILYHLAFAEEVYSQLPKNLPIDKTNFMAGNLIPDLTIKGNKKASHYRKSASIKGFFVPELKDAKKELFTLDDSVKLGMYCHLYLDYHFIENFLIPSFIWDYENQMVINPSNGKKWTVEKFFSHDGMYGSYTEINTLMLRDKRISIETVDSIPINLPITGISTFDERREKSWRDELNGYLSQKKEYTGDIFNYEKLWASIECTAKQFVEEHFS